MKNNQIKDLTPGEELRHPTVWLRDWTLSRNRNSPKVWVSEKVTRKRGPLHSRGCSGYSTDVF